MVIMKTVINVKTDKELKKEAQELAEGMGLSLTSLINAYLMQFIRDREATFSSAPRMSSGLEDLLGPIEADIKAGRNLSRAAASRRGLSKLLSN